MYNEESGQCRKRNNYKLIVDPELQKGKKKLYRLNGGAIPGKPPLSDPKDPRVVKTVLGGGTGREHELPVPRFKYDKYWVTDPPLREVFISGLTEPFSKGTALKDSCEELVGPIHSLKLHKNVQTRVFLGCASVTFLKAGHGQRAVDKLHGKVVGGTKLHVILDDTSEHMKVDTINDRRTSIDSTLEVTTPTFKETTPFFESTNHNEEKKEEGSNKIQLFSSLALKTGSLSSISESPSSGYGSLGRGQETPDSGISIKQHFDPLLALRALAAKRAPLPPVAPPPLPPAPPPPRDIETISDEGCDGKSIDVVSPFPVFEEISGDESPVMVYSTLEVEEISSDEGHGSGCGSDMDISDAENNNVIEVNVASSLPLTTPSAPPTLTPNYFTSTSYSEDTKEATPINMYNGYAHSSEMKYSPTKQWKVPPATNREERCGQSVLYCALEQLSRILLRDVEKKLVESAAFPVLDTLWDRKESNKTAVPEDGEERSEVPKPQEPYRRMLPGLVLPRQPRPLEGDTTIPTTPRKRLMNFKIPLTNRSNTSERRDTVMVAQRRLYGRKDKEGRNKRGEKRRRRDEDGVSENRSCKRRHHFHDDSEGEEDGRSQISQLSDISSDEHWSSEQEKTKRKKGKEKNNLQHGNKEEVVTGPRTPTLSSEEEREDLKMEREEEEKSDDNDSLFNDIFGTSSSSSSDFENDIASLKQPKVPPKQRLNTKKSSNKVKQEIVISPPTTQTPPIATPLSPPLIEQVKERIIEYKKRPLSEEESIIRVFINEGLDTEDVDMLRLAYSRLIDEDSELISDVPWAYYPTTSTPPKVPHYHDEDLHSSGCARSEGYYKINPSDKSKYLPHLRRSKGTNNKDKQSVPATSGRGNRLNHRRVASLFTSGDVSRELQQYNQLKARKKQLRFAKSTIHNWGLFALETVPADEMVVEYIGQVIRHGVADERERRYESQGIGSSYLFRVDYDYVIDATKIGNFARFINHCCDPNCYAKIITVANHKKIVIYSKRDIQAGEEITYDYKFPIEDEKIPCLCGAPQCRGTLN